LIVNGSLFARDEARRLARRLGCTLEYQATRHAKHVTIYLPEGSQMADNPGLDVLHHESELDEDIWPGVVDELKKLQIEPLEGRD
jgi:hypothetical protein